MSPDWVEQLVAPFGEDERIGAVGCKIFYPDGVTLQHAGGVLDGARASSTHRGYGERDMGQYDQPCELEFVTGAALALRLSALAEVGLFDEGYNPAYYEEVDLCWRLRRAGYTVRYQPTATLRHAESASITNLVRRSTLANRNRLRFVVKTFDSERLWNDFLLAERMRLATLPNSTETEVLRRAYLEGVLQREEWIAARAQFHPLRDGETARLRQLCAGLRRDMVAFDRGRVL